MGTVGLHVVLTFLAILMKYLSLKSLKNDLETVNSGLFFSNSKFLSFKYPQTIS